MKKFNFKSSLCGFMAGILVATAVPVLAYNGTKSISATFKNIKIYVDGAELTPRDSNGKILEPFIYNGSTYLPVRAVGESVGKEVSYDSNNNIVYIGSGRNTSSGYVQNQGTALTAYNTIDSCKTKDVEMSGNTYKDAVCFSDWLYKYLANNESGSAYFNLGGAYTSVSGVYGTVDDSGSNEGAYAELSFYGDGILLKTYTVTAGQIVTNFTVNVTGVSQLTITCENGDSDKVMNVIGIGDLYAK